MIVGLSLVAGEVRSQAARDTARLEHLFYVEIAALLCEMELPDETEHTLDMAIRAQQGRLRFTDRQMAAIYEKARAKVEADQEVACEIVRQLDPSPAEVDDE